MRNTLHYYALHFLFMSVMARPNPENLVVTAVTEITTAKGLTTDTTTTPTSTIPTSTIPTSTISTSTIPTSTVPTLTGKSSKFEEVEDDGLSPIITKLNVRADIQFRYAVTSVTAYVKNPSTFAQQASFRVILPEEAFISHFSMILREDSFVASVEEKAVAEDKYEHAVTSGRNAGLIASKGSNVFEVKTNLEAGEKIRFLLKYEEQLNRRLGEYEMAIRITDGDKMIPNYRVQIFLNESLPISSLSVLDLDENSVHSSSGIPDTEAEIVRNIDGDSKRARVSFEATSHSQKFLRYDVDRKSKPFQDIQVIDGYFVHFIAPDTTESLPNRVIFVLDVSGSMSGSKIEQMKDAMVTILDDLTEDDHFNILTFSDDVYNWIPTDPLSTSMITYPGSETFKRNAIQYVLNLKALDGTNINEALLKALELLKIEQEEEEDKEHRRPVILFLTDGQATVGSTTDSFEILENVRKYNEKHAAIYGLAFGDRADFALIKDVSVENGGFARRIYSTSDAAIQLEDVFAEISNPLLTNLTVKYVGEAVTNSTDPVVPVLYRGGEMLIAGKLEFPESEESMEVIIQGHGRSGLFERRLIICLREARDFPDCVPISLPPPPPPQSEAQNFIERLWAFRTIKEALKTDTEQSRETALALSLKFHFVTPMTSLVVLQPDSLMEEIADPISFNTNRINSASRGRLPFFRNFAAAAAQNYVTGSTLVTYTTTTFSNLFTTVKNSMIDNGVDLNSIRNKVCSGNITLYDMTYLRGKNVTVFSSDDDVDVVGFKLTSLSVQGSCCWIIDNSNGEQETFRFDGGRDNDGQYYSAGKMGKVFRNVASVTSYPC